MTHTIENSQNTLTNLLRQVQDQAARSQDYIAPTNQLQLMTGDRGDGSKVSQIIMEASGGMPTTILPANDVAFDQIAQRAGIDVRTARRLQQDYSSEFDGLINAIWQKEPAQRMLRTFDYGLAHGTRTGELRAFVSDKFKTFDNTHLLNAALPELMESDAQWRVVNGTVTEKRLYLRLKSDIITGDGAAVGDTMALGIGMSNSEVGCGSVNVFQMYWTLACLNGMQTEKRTRKSHITGARGDADTWGLLTDEAKDADNHALALQLRDVTRAYASAESFQEILGKMSRAHEDIIQGSPQAAVEAMGKVLALTKKETANVLDGLLATIGQSGYAGQPLTRATMVNAVTAVAHNVDADNVDDWQKLGGRVLDLPRSDWQRVAMAA
ncbi:MAG: hypothetical protein RLZZ602_1322 [Pseudomonadota bacterium]|jgi:hypothetical protein